jgi:hypothetical protein
MISQKKKVMLVIYDESHYQFRMENAYFSKKFPQKWFPNDVSPFYKMTHFLK